jgi:hypothetical protein
MAEYATELEVRLRTGFQTTSTPSEGDGKVSVSDTYVKINKEAYSVLAVAKNGTALTAGTPVLGANEYQFVAPKTVNLGTAVQANDTFLIRYGIELDSPTIDYFLSQATNIVKAYLRDRYGDDKLLEWETTTPPLIERLTAMLAGNDAKRSMADNAHKVDVMKGIDDEYDRIIDLLKKIANGELEVPDEDPLSDLQDGLVARGLSTHSIFASLSNLHKVDINIWEDDTSTDGSIFGDAYRGN